MTTAPPDILAQLYARLDAQEADLAALRARVARPRPRFPRRLRALAATGLVVALTPLALLAATPVFSDLGDAAAVHQGNIQAIGNAGITTGFEDPNNPGQRLYNPKGLVTREEMASFLARTAGLNGNPPVVNAATAQTASNATNAQNAVSAQSATNATTAQTAANATTVGGLAPGQIARIDWSTNAARQSVPLAAAQDVVIGSVMVNVTAAQIVAIDARFNYRILSGQSGCPCTYRILLRERGENVTTANTEGRITTGVIGAYNDRDNIQPLATSWVFAAAPGTHTYELVLFGTGGSGQEASNVTIRAISSATGGQNTP